MRPQSVLRFFVLLVAVVARAGIAVAADEAPPELTAARAEFEARLAVPRAKVEAAVKARVARYVSDLKELETKVAAAGQLDAVVFIGAEREAYAKDARTNGFAAGNSNAEHGVSLIMSQSIQDGITWARPSAFDRQP